VPAALLVRRAFLPTKDSAAAAIRGSRRCAFDRGPSYLNSKVLNCHLPSPADHKQLNRAALQAHTGNFSGSVFFFNSIAI
jgi:hypothetical protein